MNIINRPEFAGVYVIFIPKHMSFKYLDEFKEAFAGNDVLIVMEEMTERLSQGTEDILNFLDGYSSWNNCYVIATTNYPEVLPANLIDRPGRFNNLVEIKAPTDLQKTFFLTQKGFSEDDIKEILPRCKDFSLDYISQLALTAKLQNLKLSESFTILENNKKKVKGAFKGKTNLGL
jgi:SpoVK/Ycf46/Vps4 family AAA+-type ATPase